MRRSILLLLFLAAAARTALAVTCGGFSIVPADHVIVKYSAPLATGATASPPIASVSGMNVTVSRNVSGGSGTEVACVDDRVDLGYLGAGRFSLTWNDNTGFTAQRSTFTFFVGAPASGTVATTSVLPPAVPGQPVRLEVNACSQRAAVAYLSGNDIVISQYGSGSTCKLYVLDFGLLPASVYNVTTTRLDATHEPSSTSFRFVVQQPAPTSACTGIFSITRTASGTARLHYEDQYPGYAPTFGLPAVTDISRSADGMLVTTVFQPVADTADTTRLIPGTVPAICHAEELDIAIPEEGYNQLRWWDRVSVNGFNAGYPLTTGVAVDFYWSGGVMQCSSIPRAISPSTAIEGQPIHLLLSAMTDYGAVQKPTVNGQTVTIDIVPQMYEGPVGVSTSCGTYDVTLSSLPAGTYSVAWRLMSTGNPPQVVTSAFTVFRSPRQRAARH